MGSNPLYPINTLEYYIVIFKLLTYKLIVIYAIIAADGWSNWYPVKGFSYKSPKKWLIGYRENDRSM